MLSLCYLCRHNRVPGCGGQKRAQIKLSQEIRESAYNELVP